MTLEQAAKLFDVKHDRLKRAAWQGRLPATKIGEGRTSTYVVKPEDVETFIRTSRRGPKGKAKEVEA